MNTETASFEKKKGILPTDVQITHIETPSLIFLARIVKWKLARAIPSLLKESLCILPIPQLVPKFKTCLLQDKSLKNHAVAVMEDPDVVVAKKTNSARLL